jgi:hypothetical protein
MADVGTSIQVSYLVLGINGNFSYVRIIDFWIESAYTIAATMHQGECSGMNGFFACGEQAQDRHI